MGKGGEPESARAVTPEKSLTNISVEVSKTLTAPLTRSKTLTDVSKTLAEVSNSVSVTNEPSGGLLKSLKLKAGALSGIAKAVPKISKDKVAIGEDGMYNVEGMPDGELKRGLLEALAEISDINANSWLSKELRKPRQMFDVIMVKRHPDGVIFDLEYTLVSPISLTPLSVPVRGRSRSEWARWKLERLLHDVECGNLCMAGNIAVKPRTLVNLIDEWDCRYTQMIALNQLQVVGTERSKFVKHFKILKEVLYHTKALSNSERPLYHLTELWQIPVNSRILRESQAAVVVKIYSDSDHAQIKQLAAAVLEAWQVYM